MSLHCGLNFMSKEKGKLITEIATLRHFSVKPLSIKLFKKI